MCYNCFRTVGRRISAVVPFAQYADLPYLLRTHLTVRLVYGENLKKGEKENDERRKAVNN